MQKLNYYVNKDGCIDWSKLSETTEQLDENIFNDEMLESTLNIVSSEIKYDGFYKIDTQLPQGFINPKWDFKLQQWVESDIKNYIVSGEEKDIIIEYDSQGKIINLFSDRALQLIDITNNLVTISKEMFEKITVGGLDNTTLNVDLINKKVKSENFDFSNLLENIKESHNFILESTEVTFKDTEVVLNYSVSEEEVLKAKEIINAKMTVIIDDEKYFNIKTIVKPTIEQLEEENTILMENATIQFEENLLLKEKLSQQDEKIAEQDEKIDNVMLGMTAMFEKKFIV